MSLSERVRPDVEAAPWVCKEIADLESRLAESEARAEEYRRDAERATRLAMKYIDPMDMYQEDKPDYAALAASVDKGEGK